MKATQAIEAMKTLVEKYGDMDVASLGQEKTYEHTGSVIICDSHKLPEYETVDEKLGKTFMVIV